MINYTGPRAVFAVKQHPRTALADILHMSAAVERLTAERVVLQQRVTELEAARATDGETINAGWRQHVEDIQAGHAAAYAALRQHIADLERTLAECRARLPL
jgi:hypothetical protein